MIEVRGLTKRYGATTAVDHLTFEVQPGSVTGFLGPNGSGKSTTMRMVMGLDHPTAGQALVNGCRYRGLAWPLREVGALLDGRAYHPGRSAEHHLLALAQANAIPASRVAEVLDLVGLTSVAHRRTRTFSLGMGQRLGIAAALLGDPGVVLLDEPVNGLDPEGIRWLRHLVRGLADEGRAVLLSSHLISEVSLVADRLVVIGRGRLVAELSVAELQARAPRYVRVRSSQPERLLGALAAAGADVRPQGDGAVSVTGLEASVIAGVVVRAGIPLDELAPERSSLEEVFMELTADSADYRTSPPPDPLPGRPPGSPSVPLPGTLSTLSPRPRGRAGPLGESWADEPWHPASRRRPAGLARAGVGVREGAR